MYLVYLPAEEKRTMNHTWFTVDRTSIVFEVKACADASLVMASVPFVVSSQVYEIVIGRKNNTGCNIKTNFGGEPAKSVDSPNILHCDEYRWFWASWTGGHIKLGRGTVIDSDLVIDYIHDNPYAVSAVSIANGYGYSGMWRFLKDTGLLCNTST